MKALPLWQPWATLVAIGAKRVETRHWAPPWWMVGTRVAIYATKEQRHLHLADDEQPFRKHLGAHLMPLGAIVGSVLIVRCTEMTASNIAALADEHPDERAFGHYEPGRFAWVLRFPEQLDRAVPFAWPVKGPARYIDVPDDLLGYTPPQGTLL